MYCCPPGLTIDNGTAGNNVISYYLPLLVAQVGIKDSNTQILLNAIYALTGWIAATAGAFSHDKFGRRKMFMASTAGMVVCLAITAGGVSIPMGRGLISVWDTFRHVQLIQTPADPFTRHF